jgi:2',3'-cyclic-nucleotide 2'-phosphodiesterase/3'-nucleotidase
VAAIGNHDIEAGHPVYDKLVKEVKAPMICANIVDEKTGRPYFPPYVVIKRQGIKIAVLGLTEPKITEQLPNAFWSGLDVLDMVETARKWVPIIQTKEKPDLLIGLFHAGADYTYGGQTADTPKNENASQLVVEKIPGFDFILIGHDHAGWDGIIIYLSPFSPTKRGWCKDPTDRSCPYTDPWPSRSHPVWWNFAPQKWDRVSPSPG